MFKTSQAISGLLEFYGKRQEIAEGLWIAGANMLAAVVLFVVVYRRKGLE